MTSDSPRQTVLPALQRYDYYQGPKSLGDVWTLTKESLKLRCALATHRLGWELRLTAGANFLRRTSARANRRSLRLRKCGEPRPSPKAGRRISLHRAEREAGVEFSFRF